MLRWGVAGDTGILATSANSEPWVKRLSIPSYPVGDAARYAHIAPSTIRSWQKLRAGRAHTLTERERRVPLTYLQLIEVAVVASFRKAGLTLATIRGMRDYASQKLGSKHPFAEYEFAQSGDDLLLKYGDWAGPPEDKHWLSAKRGGQLAWDTIIAQAIKSFEYERNIAIRWHVAGDQSPVIIDPRIAFGSPSVAGLPTTVFKQRWLAGEPIVETADDYDVTVAQIRNALQFEGINPDAAQPEPCLH